MLHRAARVTQDLSSWDLESEETEQVLGHEDAYYWAHFIYYGPDVDWWRIPPDDLAPKPWQ
ncbi:MAG TPA: hypothetical protein VMO88_08610 [Acidimicrobiales bacterium]|nr:hypothetical protein [Acidimicrobiales bacterium]